MYSKLKAQGSKLKGKGGGGVNFRPFAGSEVNEDSEFLLGNLYGKLSLRDWKGVAGW